MSRSLIPAFVLSSLLAACGSPPSEADLEPRGETLTPTCSECGALVVCGGTATAPNDEISLIIASEFVGLIEDAWFIEHTDDETITHTFDPSVIDDLNDPETTETVVLLEFSGIAAGEVVFKVDGEESHESIDIDWEYPAGRMDCG